MPSPTTPHLALPLTFSGGQFVAVEQDSTRHYQDRAEVVARTRPGMIEADPELGLVDLVARSGSVTPEIMAALEDAIDAPFVTDEDRSQIMERVVSVSIDVQLSEEP